MKIPKLTKLIDDLYYFVDTTIKTSAITADVDTLGNFLVMTDNIRQLNNDKFN